MALNELQIERVWVEWLYDANPDVSYLESTPEAHYGKDGANWNHVPEEEKNKIIAQYGSIWDACVAYAKQDADRLKAFHHEEWWMLGCVAAAEVSYPLNKQGHRRMQTFSSSGLWGIESDSGSEYRSEIEDAQLKELRGHMSRFGVDVNHFDTIEVAHQSSFAAQ